MTELTTKEFNEIYKKYFKEYFDKPLKEDGFRKKGTINFYRMNKLGLIECLNFQRHYDNMTVNYLISPIYCPILKTSMALGDRIGYLRYREDYWWELKNEEQIKESMENILEVIRNDLYKWFQKYEDKNEYIKLTDNPRTYEDIYKYLLKATTAAKFRNYENILINIQNIKKEYEELEELYKTSRERVFKEALLLEEKLKEGKESVDEYIIEREKQSLIELGLDKMFNKKKK